MPQERLMPSEARRVAVTGTPRRLGGEQIGHIAIAERRQSAVGFFDYDLRKPFSRNNVGSWRTMLMSACSTGDTARTATMAPNRCRGLIAARRFEACAAARFASPTPSTPTTAPTATRTAAGVASAAADQSSLGTAPNKATNTAVASVIPSGRCTHSVVASPFQPWHSLRLPLRPSRSIRRNDLLTLLREQLRPNERPIRTGPSVSQ
ncbi:hypothetical protein SAMN05216551_102353 [Chitinasiproducens palmae]|uniref:Uncharacterized protein n=1 Tax=Chitinasiproducens palmae TaxID=1770053 RepID=A0A1H2PL75_9BURK|nr:hypothetical protein SAMN05216551_102353 [Chitinasiproducens palmae]